MQPSSPALDQAQTDSPADATERQTSDAAALGRALLALDKSASVTQLLAEAGRCLYRRVPAELITVSLLDRDAADEQGEPSLAADYLLYDLDSGRRGPTAIERSSGPSIFTRIAVDGEPLVALGSEDSGLALVSTDNGPVVLAPLKATGMVFGSLNISRGPDDRFKAHEVATITLAAEILASMMATIEAEGRAGVTRRELTVANHVAERRANELKVLSRVVHLLSQDADLQATLGQVARQFIELRGIDQCEIEMTCGERRYHVEAVGNDAEATEIPPAVTNLAAEAREAILAYDDDEPGLLVELLIQAEMSSFAAIPVIDAVGEVVGSIALVSTGPHRRVQRAHLDVAEAVAEQLATKSPPSDS